MPKIHMYQLKHKIQGDLSSIAGIGNKSQGDDQGLILNNHKWQKMINKDSEIQQKDSNTTNVQWTIIKKNE
jgi:hypothetical protein